MRLPHCLLRTAARKLCPIMLAWLLLNLDRESSRLLVYLQPLNLRCLLSTSTRQIINRFILLQTLIPVGSIFSEILITVLIRLERRGFFIKFKNPSSWVLFGFNWLRCSTLIHIVDIPIHFNIINIVESLFQPQFDMKTVRPLLIWRFYRFYIRRISLLSWAYQ
jgi:hypothetical protein